MIVIYPTDASVHFPPHFQQVYHQDIAGDIQEPIQVVACSSRAKPPNDAIIWAKKTNKANLVAKIMNFFSIFITLLFKVFPHQNFKSSSVILVHNDPLVATVVRLYTHMRGKKFIYRITHLMYEELIDSKSSRYRFILSLLKTLRNHNINKSDHVIVMSSEMKRYLYLATNIHYESISVMESTVAETQTTSADRPAQYKNEIDSFAVDNESVKLCYLGTLSASRDLFFVFEVLDIFRQKGVAFKLGILGVGSEKEFNHLTAEINKRQLTKEISIFSNLNEEEMIETIKLFNIGLSYYPYEKNRSFLCNSPLKSLNYIFSGLYVIGSDIPENNEILEKSGGGCVVKNHPECFAEAIISYRQNQKIPSDDPKNWIIRNRSIKSSKKKLIAIVRQIKHVSSNEGVV